MSDSIRVRHGLITQAIYVQSISGLTVIRIQLPSWEARSDIHFAASRRDVV